MSDESDEWARTRQDAVEYLTLVIDGRDYLAKRSGWTDEIGETVTLPLAVARLVLAAAQAGVHKGQGQGGVRLTRSKRNRRYGFIPWARDKKIELFEKHKGAWSMDKCEDEAAKWAQEKFRLNLALSTIKGDMGRSSPL